MCRTNGVSDHWCVGPMVCLTNGVSDQWSVTLMTGLMYLLKIKIIIHKLIELLYCNYEYILYSNLVVNLETFDDAVCLIYVIFTFTLQYTVHISHMYTVQELRGCILSFFTFQMNPLVAIITFQPITWCHLIFCFIRARCCCTRWIMLVTVLQDGFINTRYMAMEIVHVILLHGKLWQSTDNGILK